MCLYQFCTMISMYVCMYSIVFISVQGTTTRHTALMTLTGRAHLRAPSRNAQARRYPSSTTTRRYRGLQMQIDNFCKVSQECLDAPSCRQEGGGLPSAVGISSIVNLLKVTRRANEMAFHFYTLENHAHYYQWYARVYGTEMEVNDTTPSGWGRTERNHQHFLASTVLEYGSQWSFYVKRVYKDSFETCIVH